MRAARHGVRRDAAQIAAATAIAAPSQGHSAGRATRVKLPPIDAARPSTATGIAKRAGGAGLRRRRRREPVVVPDVRAPCRHAHPARAVLRDEPVGRRGRRARVHPDTVRPDPDQRLAQDPAHEQLGAVVDARLERPVAVEHAHVHAAERLRRRDRAAAGSRARSSHRGRARPPRPEARVR